MKRALAMAAWVTVTGLTSGALALRFWSDDRRTFLPGATTSGHYQIELDCESCHARGGGLREDACTRCHGAELAAVEDSHPKQKFLDPRNADRRALLDATRCEVCHQEHVPVQTRPLGVSLPDDFCRHCHADIAEHRPTHAGLPFETCGAAGCHNFHDNQALYQSFLLKHADEPAQRDPVSLPVRFRGATGEVPAPDGPPEKISVAVVAAWRRSGHAANDVNCRGCHSALDAPEIWVDEVGQNVCRRCHQDEVSGFVAGKHGMRLSDAVNVGTPMTVTEARLPMHAAARGRSLSCASCHDSHGVDTRVAAAEACQGCHADEHTQAFAASPHGQLWQRELRGDGAPGTGVSCATCHMPRTPSGEAEGRVQVEHNQNANLRPNEKMIRGVCLACHGLPFTLDALADPALIRTNFSGRPARRVASIEMARQQVQDAARAKKKTTK